MLEPAGIHEGRAKITEAQTSAWNQLAEAVRAAAEQHNEAMKVILGRERPKTLPERLTA
jgi:hypothetical protein